MNTVCKHRRHTGSVAYDQARSACQTTHYQPDVTLRQPVASSGPFGTSIAITVGRAESPT